MPKRRRKFSWKEQLFLIFGVICAVVFTGTSIILMVGMLPTMVAVFTDTTRERLRGLTIGTLNLAGCMPFILELWNTGHSTDNALNILTNPLAWVIMYVSAGVGYCLEWVSIGVASIYMSERAQSTIKSINKEQESLIERWGEEVSGRLALDEYGFPLQTAESAAKNILSDI